MGDLLIGDCLTMLIFEMLKYVSTKRQVIWDSNWFQEVYFVEHSELFIVAATDQIQFLSYLVVANYLSEGQQRKLYLDLGYRVSLHEKTCW